MKKRKNKILKIIIAIFMCMICTFSFAGCLMVSGNVAGGGKTSSGNKKEEEKKQEDPFIDNPNDVMMGAIGVYEMNSEEGVFYDKYQERAMSFETLLNRQFITFTLYMCRALDYIYGDGMDNQMVLSSQKEEYAFGAKQIQFEAVEDALNGASPTITNIVTDANIEDNQTFFYFKGSTTSKFKLHFVPDKIEKDENGEDKVVEARTANYKSDDYSNAMVLNPTPAWNIDDINDNEGTTRTNIMYALIDIANNPNFTKISVGEETLDNLKFNNSELKNKFVDYKWVDDPKIENIDVLGLTNDYLVKVAYFIAYTLIGKDAIGADGLSTTIPSIAVNSVTEDNVQKYQDYKAYGIIIPLLLKNANKFSIEGANIVVKEDNSLTTPFPRLKAEMYIFYDDVNDIADSVDPNPKVDYSDPNWDENNETEPLIEGDARRLKEIIYIPYINPNGITVPDLLGDMDEKGEELVKVDSFQIKYLLFGMMSVEDDFNVRIDYEFCYDDGTKSPESSKVIFSKYREKEYEDEVLDYKEDLITYFDNSFDDEYINDEDAKDGSMYEDSQSKEGKEKIKNCRFGNALISGCKTADESKKLVEDSFKKFTHTVENNGRNIEIGVLAVHNALFDENMELNFDKNYLRFKFVYTDDKGNELEEIPYSYMMEWRITN